MFGGVNGIHVVISYITGSPADKRAVRQAAARQRFVNSLVSRDVAIRARGRYELVTLRDGTSGWARTCPQCVSPDGYYYHPVRNSFTGTCSCAREAGQGGDASGD